MANRDKKIAVGRKATASPLIASEDDSSEFLAKSNITIKEEPLDDYEKPPPTKSTRKPRGLKDPKRVIKRTFALSLKAKTKVNAKLGKSSIITKGRGVKKTLLKNGVAKSRVIRRKAQNKVSEEDDKPPVLEPIYPINENNIEKKSTLKKKTVKPSDPNYCSIMETIESIISQSASQPKKKQVKVIKKAKESAQVRDTVSESIEDVVRDLQYLIKTEDIKEESNVEPLKEKPKLKKKPKVEQIKKKLKKENIENELSKIDTSNSKVIDMLDLNVGKSKRKMKAVENRRHSIEKFPITNQDVKVQNTALFTNLPRSISPRNKRSIKLRRSVDSKRSSPYTTRSDSPARMLRNGKQRKLQYLLDGIDSEYKKRKRYLSDCSGSVSKLSGYESDSSYSDLASLHSGEHMESTEKDSISKRDTSENLDSSLDVTPENIKRSLSTESSNKDVENKNVDTNSNLCSDDIKDVLTVPQTGGDLEIFVNETISPSFKVPEKSIILNIMKQTFNDIVIEEQESEKRKTRSSNKKKGNEEDSAPGVSTIKSTNDIELKTEEQKKEEINPIPEITSIEPEAALPEGYEEKVIENDNNIETKVEADPPPSLNGDLELDISDDKADKPSETPESLVIKHQILQALGLQSLQAAEEAKLRKVVPKNDQYTGTLKTVIKINRLEKKKGRNPLKMTLTKKGKSTHGKDDEMGHVDEDEYKILKEGNSSHSWKNHQGSQSSDTAGALRKSHYSNRSNLDGSSEHTSDGDTNANEEGSGKVLVIPEKASSFSIHPGRLCKDECSYCFGKFGLFDTPCHIAQMKSVDRQNKILAAEKHLTRDSCLCDACYRHVDRKTNVPSYTSNKSLKRNSLVAPGPRQNHCHVLGCGLVATNILRRKWLIKMRKSVCEVINIDLDNPGLHSIPICEEHYSSLEHLMVCAMCKRKLARDHIHYLGPESTDLNSALNDMGIPVKLHDKPVVCKWCRHFASLVLKDPDERSENSLDFYLGYKKRLLHFHDVEVMDEAEAEEPIPAPVKDKEIVKKKKKVSKNQNLDPPVLEPQVDIENKEEPKCRVPSTDSREQSPSDLIDYNTLIPSIAMESTNNDIELTRREISKKTSVSIKRIRQPESIKEAVEKSKKFKNSSDIVVQRLGSNPSISVRQLFPGEEDLPLNGTIEFGNVKERTPEGWEKCVSTIQYDPEIKMLWSELQKPYGNQSSFLRHLILLEKYFRNGDLVLSPNASHHSVNYSESVQNRLRAYDNIPSNVGPIQPLSMIPFNKSQQKSASGIVTSIENVHPLPPPLPPPLPLHLGPSSSPPKLIPPVSSCNSSFLVPNPAAMVGATVTINTNPTTSALIPTASAPLRPKLPPGLISLQPGTKIPVTPVVKVPQSQKIKFPITKNWRPNLIPIDPLQKPEKKPGLVQVISGGKPYHITLEDYKKMCAIKRTFDLRQKRLQEAQKNSNSILKSIPPRKGLVISKTSTTVSKPESNSDQETENSLEKLDKTVEKLEAKLSDTKTVMIMPKIPKSLTVIPQTVKKPSRPSSPTLLITQKSKQAGKS